VLEDDAHFTLRCSSAVSHLRSYTNDGRVRAAFTATPVLREQYQEDAQMEHSVSQMDAAAASTMSNAVEHDYDYVLVTVPLGVLQQHPHFFAHSSDDKAWLDKRAAIRRLGMGIEIRVFLCFDRCMWPSHVYWLREAYSAAGSKRPSLNEAEPWRFFYTNQALSTPSSFHILVACASPYHAQHHLVRMSQDELKDDALVALARMLGDAYEACALHSFFASHWHRDRFSYGAYSYIPANASQQDVQALAAPLHPVYWAGEATHSCYMSQATGAMETGERAAKEIMSAHTQHYDSPNSGFADELYDALRVIVCLRTEIMQ
jgi:monoamine oxidase